MQLIRSLAFNTFVYVWMAVIGIAFLPFAIFSKEAARKACDTYARHVMGVLPWMVGLKTEIRGMPPAEECLVAAKHQSFMDILLMWTAIPRGFFIMKSILQYAPVIGQYGLRIGCIPVNRGRRSDAIKAMLASVADGSRSGGQLLIYPQGTRVAPGAVLPYKVGTFALYEQLGQPCYPVATNVGLFWPKRGFLRKPGLAVVEFLEPIPVGLDRATFMHTLEERIETASNKLMEEAGFTIPAPPPTPAPVAVQPKT